MRIRGCLWKYLATKFSVNLKGRNEAIIENAITNPKGFFYSYLRWKWSFVSLQAMNWRFNCSLLQSHAGSFTEKKKTLYNQWYFSFLTFNSRAPNEIIKHSRLRLSVTVSQLNHCLYNRELGTLKLLGIISTESQNINARFENIELVWDMVLALKYNRTWNEHSYVSKFRRVKTAKIAYYIKIIQPFTKRKL